MMRTLIGIFVMTIPFIIVFSYAFYKDWISMVLTLCFFLLVLDFVGWVVWFYKLGSKIAGFDDE